MNFQRQNNWDNLPLYKNCQHELCDYRLLLIQLNYTYLMKANTGVYIIYIQFQKTSYRINFCIVSVKIMSVIKYNQSICLIITYYINQIFNQIC